MPMATSFAEVEPTRAEIDARAEPVLLEFGAPWCGYCQRAQPHIAAALASHPDLEHLKIEDGSGRPLGRSFRIKLWPTLVLTKRGEELARVVRPTSSAQIEDVLARLHAAY
jgi:thioredoxin 1